MTEEKIRFQMRIDPDTDRKIKAAMPLANSRSQNEFVEAVRRLMEQARERKRLHLSLPQVRLPRPSLEWLLVPVILLGLLALWYGGTTLWSGLELLLAPA